MSKPAAARPVIVIDTREQDPLPILGPSIRDGLVTGDYSVAGGETDFAVERKSLDDLAGCCCGDNRERFERELVRMRGYHFRRLLVIGSPEAIAARRYHSQIHQASVLNSLAAWEVRYGVPVVFAPTPEDGARRVVAWAAWYVREIGMRAEAVARAAEDGTK